MDSPNVVRLQQRIRYPSCQLAEFASLFFKSFHIRINMFYLCHRGRESCSRRMLFPAGERIKSLLILFLNNGRVSKCTR